MRQAFEKDTVIGRQIYEMVQRQHCITTDLVVRRVQTSRELDYFVGFLATETYCMDCDRWLITEELGSGHLLDTLAIGIDYVSIAHPILSRSMGNSIGQPHHPYRCLISFRPLSLHHNRG